ncbi:hypothetical protein Pmi06nite_52640 [Planotetraspora mira]|uniref:Uncharacterized protein n=1 Tax=Planotetraspora mira TaxID=58121 RepID=A0A8J3X867_9ACTN|nr:hypothetical protein Pmi06nite_52640 [Planotetraspora mira]
MPLPPKTHERPPRDAIGRFRLPPAMGSAPPIPNQFAVDDEERAAPLTRVLTALTRTGTTHGPESTTQTGTTQTGTRQ